MGKPGAPPGRRSKWDAPPSAAPCWRRGRAGCDPEELHDQNAVSTPPGCPYSPVAAAGDPVRTSPRLPAALWAPHPRGTGGASRGRAPKSRRGVASSSEGSLGRAKAAPLRRLAGRRAKYSLGFKARVHAGKHKDAATSENTGIRSGEEDPRCFHESAGLGHSQRAPQTTAPQTAELVSCRSPPQAGGQVGLDPIKQIRWDVSLPFGSSEAEGRDLCSPSPHKRGWK